jgi:hypothetical protein
MTLICSPQSDAFGHKDGLHIKLMGTFMSDIIVAPASPIRMGGMFKWSLLNRFIDSERGAHMSMSIAVYESLFCRDGPSEYANLLIGCGNSLVGDQGWGNIMCRGTPNASATW